jgi:hypothetical protein
MVEARAKIYMRKTLAIIETPLMSPNFDVQMWLLNRFCESNEVYVAICGEDSSCFQNPFGLSSICNICKKRIKSAMPAEVKLIQFSSGRKLIANSDFANLERYVESTYISRFRTKNNLHFSIGLLARKKLKVTTECIYLNVIDVVKEFGITDVLTYNGRFNISGAAIEVAKSYSLDYHVLELMGRDNNVFLTYNSEVFDRKYWSLLLDVAITKSPQHLQISGKEFFNKKFTGQRTNDFVYVGNGLVDNSILDKKYDFLFAFSSEDEFESLGPEWTSNFGRQEDVVMAVAKAFPYKNIAVRFHPNQSYIPKGELNSKFSILSQLSNVDIFSPRHKITSYDLLRVSEYVIGFGSTFLLESGWYGKKVIQVGHSLYEEMKIMRTVQTSGDLISALNDDSTLFFDKEKSEYYAGFLMSYTSLQCDLKYISDWLNGVTKWPMSRGSSILYNAGRALEAILSGRGYKYGFFGSIARALKSRFI